MQRPGRRPHAGIVVAALLLCGATVPGGRPASREQLESGAKMRDAARALLDVAGAYLGDLQTRSDHQERRNWNYTPVPRRGLPLFAVEDEAVRERIWGLVDTGLGERGRRQAREVRLLEEILYARSGQDDRRNPGRYFLTLFGVPGSLGSWGWRFEGHHLSLNFSVRNGVVVGTTPAFFGGSPAHVREGEHAGLQPFAAEEEDARALVLALPHELRQRAVISSSAPGDILTGNDVPAARPPLLGVAYADLGAPARTRLLDLLNLYASRLDPQLAASEMSAIEAAGLDGLHFAWAGGLEPGGPHYYRIQGSSFVIEYDASQDDGNHVHTVWRNFERDFGNDPLRAHLDAVHRHQRAAGTH